MAFEDAREEFRSHLIYNKLIFLGTITVAKLLITNFKDVKKLRSLSNLSERYVRPARKYEIPPHEPGMRECTSRERYLHPTRYCNSRAPQIVAMAHQLGAYRLSDREYAKAAFEFAKEMIYTEMIPLDREVDTLQRGTGTCFHINSLFVALCRAAGIKARYKMFSIQDMIAAWEDTYVNNDPIVSRWYNAMGYFLLEGECEVCLDGKWIPANVSPVAERQAAAGIAISRLGEDSIGRYLTPRPGSIMRFEAMPAGLPPASRMLFRISPSSMERSNLGLLRQVEKGRKVLEEAGGAEAYDRKIRAQQGENPEVDLEPRDEIEFR